MCRIIKFVLSCLFVLFIQIASAQTTLIIPPGNPPTDTVSMLYLPTQNFEEARKPLGTYWGYERTAFIFSHSEIGMYGQITSISVYCDSVNVPGDVPLNVYVREVTDSIFTTQTTVANEETGALLVYSTTIPSYSFATKQWITIPFTTSFTHAAHNKAVEFIFETNANGTGNEGEYGKFFTHYQPASNLIIAQYWNQDGSPPQTVGTTLSYYRPNVQMTINTIPVCGMPTTGTIVATSAFNADSLVDTLCINQGIVLSLLGTTSVTGLAYQWQDSIIGSSSFTNILGADSTVLLTSLTYSATTWYRCMVKCTSANDSAYSNIKQITLRNYLNCYCTAGLGGGCVLYYPTAIDSVAIPGTTLANGLTGCSTNNYTLYPYGGNTTAVLSQGAGYKLYTRYNGNVCSSFWIDYNQNGLLEPSEWTQICLQSPSQFDTMTVDGVVVSQIDSVFITTFTVSPTAALGKTLMRIRTVAGGNLNDSTSLCDYFATGETEDYYVTITYPLGINQVASNNMQVTVYPNPANESLTLSLPKGEAISNINVYDITGRLVIQQSKPNTQFFTIDVSSLFDGVYFTEITTNKGSCTQKFIIAK